MSGREPQAYGDHVRAVISGAAENARAIAAHAQDRTVATALVRAVEDAAALHDLGKLDPDNQAALRAEGRQSLPWDHVDAGVAYLLANGAETAAWVVRAHHCPGLPSRPLHFVERGRNLDQVRKLRGRRNDEAETLERHQEQVRRTDETLHRLLHAHIAEIGETQPQAGKPMHGLPLRLALSCLVDADHADTARFQNDWNPPTPPAPRWEERLAALDTYVANLNAKDSARGKDRAAFYAACRHRPPDISLAACEGPVGIGKTTAVAAYLIRRAIETKARRLFVIAPYTAILSQTASKLRQALVLPDEQPSSEMVVAEHHHRADFERISSRDLAILWQSPIILTTAVQFFETLASNQPAVLRKLHALPGSVVFLDEAHAALPAQLWPQNWRWLKSLAEDWGCSFVFASGSLARFWENEDIVGEGEAVMLPDLAPRALGARLNALERDRVTYRTLGRLEGPEAIAEAVCRDQGPRLLILNTVQSAAFLADHMRKAGCDVLHISTALSPADRKRVLDRITGRLANPDDRDWTLVATSLVEAGVDLSFYSAFRERFSAASLIQVGGRVNRHSELAKAAVVSDFFFDATEQLRRHPGAVNSASVLGELFQNGRFYREFDPASLVTDAMRREISGGPGRGQNRLLKSECAKNYPEVAKHGCVIDTGTRLVVVDPVLRDRLRSRQPIKARDLLAGSVQIRRQLLQDLRLEPIAGRSEIFYWSYCYDKDFLGYMAAILKLQESGSLIV